MTPGRRMMCLHTAASLCHTGANPKPDKFFESQSPYTLTSARPVPHPVRSTGTQDPGPLLVESRRGHVQAKDTTRVSVIEHRLTGPTGPPGSSAS